MKSKIFLADFLGHIYIHVPSQEIQKERQLKLHVLMNQKPMNKVICSAQCNYMREST